MRATDAERRKQRLEARLTAKQKKYIERAAQIKGTSVSDFVIWSANEAAERTIREQEVLALNEHARKVFVEALLHPPSPGKKLVAAARRYLRGTRRAASAVSETEGQHMDTDLTIPGGS